MCKLFVLYIVCVISWSVYVYMFNARYYGINNFQCKIADDLHVFCCAACHQWSVRPWSKAIRTLSKARFCSFLPFVQNHHISVGPVSLWNGLPGSWIVSTRPSQYLIPINTHCFGYCLVRNGSDNATLRMVDVGYVILIAPNVRAGSCRHEAAGDVDVPFCFDMKQPSTYLRQCRPTVFKSVDVMGLHSMVPRL